MVDDMFQPRRSTRPRWKHGFLETLCKYPPRAISSLARKPPYRQAEANALSRKGQVSYVTHVAAVDPARRLPADGTKRLAGFGPGRHDHRFADARNALRNKPARDERETSKIASHGADSPRETAQTRHHTSSNLSQSRGDRRIPTPRAPTARSCCRIRGYSSSRDGDGARRAAFRLNSKGTRRGRPRT